MAKKDSTPYDILYDLYATILSRKDASPEKSYVAKLLAKGVLKIAQKVGEEGVETALAAVAEEKKALVNESADLLFHLWILLAARSIDPSEVMEELTARHGVSGLDEKKARREKP